MNTVIINDCRDANAIGRQIARTSSLLNSTATFIAVTSDIEAAGNIIDTLDAFGEYPGIVLANVAPRNGKAKKWENGTPFGYFRYKQILVCTSIDGFVLSLVKKFKLISSITVLDLPDTLDYLIADNALQHGMKDMVIKTQFRSFDFLPRVAAYVAKGKKLNGNTLRIQDIPDAPPVIWWIDSFGNCKTTLLRDDAVQFSAPFDVLPYFERLKDVPDVTSAIISGSSGIGEERFLEIVVQGGSAEKEFNMSVGNMVTKPSD